MSTYGLNRCTRVGSVRRCFRDEVSKHPPCHPRICNPHFAFGWKQWEASRRRRKVGASVLGRENASQNGAEARLAMSTSTWSMSTITQPASWSSTQVLWRRPFCTAAAARQKLQTSEAVAGESFYAPMTGGVWCVRGRQVF